MQSPPVIRTALNFGALCGLSNFAVFLILYYSGKNPLSMLSWYAAPLPILFMILATRHYRNRENGGLLRYDQGFRVSFLTSVAGAFVYGAIVWIFITAFDGSIMEMVKQEYLANLELSEGMMKSLLGEEAFEQSLESIDNLTPYNLVTSDVFYKVLGGLICSLIIAAFLRRVPYLKEE